MQLNWLGEFQYGFSESAEKFEFSMSVQMNNDIFSGKFLDTELSRLVNVHGEVVGQIQGDQITFVFKYPFLYDDINGEDIELDFLEEGHEVLFSGKYYASEDLWLGDWIIAGEFTEEEMEMNRGRWNMCKVDQLIHFNQNSN